MRMKVRVTGGERALEAIKAAREQARRLAGHGVEIGIHDEELALSALMAEFGSPSGRVPERPFFRPALPAIRRRARAIVAAHAARPEGVGRDTLEAIGEAGVEVLQDSIDRVTKPPLAPSTLRARKRRGSKSKKPLIDSGAMRKGLGHRVT